MKLDMDNMPLKSTTPLYSLITYRQ